VQLTEKDKTFLEHLTRLIESQELFVQLKHDHPSYLVLRGTYGARIHEVFRMSRQGVRWRFQRLFNGVYVSAFETILFIESVFGSQLRDDAIRISRERYNLRHQVAESSFVPADSLGCRREKRRE
jgi:hypothetical protein